MSTVTAFSEHRLEPAPSQLDPDQDRRSSSLSEISDHEGVEELETIDRINGDDTDANDTEAETERLENTPLKGRKHQNVILTADNDIYSSRASPLGNVLSSEYPSAPSGTTSYTSLNFPDDQLLQTSDISSLEDLSEGEANNLSRTSSPRKRKRSSSGDESDSVQGTLNIELVGKSPSNTSLSPRVSPSAERHISEEVLPAEHANDSERSRSRQAPTKKQNTQMGKRKGKKVVVEDESNTVPAVDRRENSDEVGGSGEALYSNGEDAEAEDAADADLDNASKSAEGLLKKKSALDSLTALEKCFATLRDKLFDERLTSANEELALLQQPGLLHPELIAMKEAVDQHRAQKIEYQRTFLKFKLQALQKESVAAKHQIHSQYMQTVRDIRDRSLEQINKEFYQVQRERRSCEGDVPDFIYTYKDRRSQQITQQTAYNNEISVLSGVAKYVGFPAAPGIKKARPDELEDDMRKMGIAIQAPQALQQRPSPFGANLTSAASFPRHTPHVEEHFLERNAWANPQHPAHQQQRQQMHRQLSQVSGAPTPSATPTGQDGLTDLTEPRGSASTVPNQPSAAANSLVHSTPATGELTKPGLGPNSGLTIRRGVDETPSRIKSILTDAMLMGKEIQGSLAPRPNSPQPARKSSPSVTRNPPVRDSHTPNTLPKPLPFTQSASSRASPPVRLPVKVEDIGQLSGHSPASHQFGSPVPTIAAGPGQTN